MSPIDPIRREHDERAPVSIHDMTVAYDRRPVLWDVDLDIPEGTLACIVGPNGAGKSTLLKACLGIIPSVSGDVRFWGRPIQRQRARVALQLVQFGGQVDQQQMCVSTKARQQVKPSARSLPRSGVQAVDIGSI